MARRLVLHIGSMKSGTSFVQNVLGHHRERLAESGVLFAGSRWREQVKAVRELIERGGPGQRPMPVDGSWAAVVEDASRWEGTAVVSMEFLGPRSEAKIEQILAAFPDTTVEAVMTCRDLSRNIPAMWLESMQNGSSATWPDFLAAVRDRDRDSPIARNFWRHQDLPVIAERWARVLGEGRLTLVTVPPSGAPHDLLWRRFAEVLGVDPSGYDLEVRSNRSIGPATAMVLRRLNEKMVVDGAVPQGYDRFVKHSLAKRGLVARTPLEPRLGLDEEWVREEAHAQVERLTGAGHRVVGDLEDLRPVRVPGVHTDEISAEDQLAAAVDGLELLVREWGQSERKQRRAARRQGSGPAGRGEED